MKDEAGRPINIVGRLLKSGHRSVLGKRFRFPPFSVWSARDGDWQSRKRYWVSLGIKSELGRGEGLTLNGDVGDDIDHYRHEKARATTYNTGGPGTLAKQFNSAPGNSPLPATVNYNNGARGDGRGRRINKYHAQPGGGPSHKSVYLGSSGKPVGGSESINAKKGETASLKDGLTYGTTLHPYDDYEPDDDVETSQTGTSIFDPVVCELCYRWFCPMDGNILDPFAGGSVRGIIAGVLGRFYVGIDLRREQVEANIQQAEIICRDNEQPVWICDDSRYALDDFDDRSVDFVFSCPPYYDLELYSGNPDDLSNMTWDEFCTAYKTIITKSVSKLKNNRFAAFVVGDLRDKRGIYRNLPALTVQYFGEAGCELFNEAVLVTSVGSLPLRVAKQFNKSRKFGRSHQSVLVFIKGDPVLAAAQCEPVELLDTDTERLKQPEVPPEEPPTRRRRARLDSESAV